MAGTSTIKSSGGDYTTLAAWESAKQADLPTAAAGDEIAECYTFVDTSLVKVDGWTTGASDKIIIRAAAGEQHTGVRGTGYRIEGTAGFGALDFREAYGEIDGLALKITGATEINGISNRYGDAKVAVKIKNCFIYDTAPGTGVRWGGAGVTVENCIVVGCGLDGYAYSGVGTCSYCVSLNNERGFSSNGNVINCIVAGASQVYEYVSNGAGSDYNISEETGTYKAPGANSITGVSATASLTPGAGTWVGFTNITAGSEDAHLIDFTDASVNQAFDTGTNISGITTDIDGDTRHATTPDIGADEFVAAAGGGLPAGSLASLGVGV